MTADSQQAEREAARRWYYAVRGLLGWVQNRGHRPIATEDIREVATVYYERGRAAGRAKLEGALRELLDKGRAYSLAESRGDWSMLATTREAFRAAHDTTRALLDPPAEGPEASEGDECAR